MWTWIIIRQVGRSSVFFLPPLPDPLEVFWNQNQMLNRSRLLFYYPFTALTIIFSHVIANPLLPTARNDIALMDVVTGLFGRLDFVSSGLMSCNESGEFTRLARATVDRAIANHKGRPQDGYHKGSLDDLSSTSHTSSSPSGGRDSMTGSGMVLPGGLARTPLGSSNSFLGNTVAGATPGTDMNSVGGMDFSLSSDNMVIEGVNALLAENPHSGGFRDHCSVNGNGNGNVLTGFDWASINIHGWPDIGPDYLQANYSF